MTEYRSEWVVRDAPYDIWTQQTEGKMDSTYRNLKQCPICGEIHDFEDGVCSKG